MLSWLITLTAASALQLGPRDIRGELRAGSRFVPCHDFNPGWREKREALFARGALVGVEFTVEEVLDGGATPVPSVAEGDDVSLVMRPSYRLASQYERSDWPVTVPLDEIPFVISSLAYDVLYAALAIVSAALAAGAAALASMVISLSVIPSASMEPTLEPRDVLLIEKLTPALRAPCRSGEIVFFRPPRELAAVVARAGGVLSDRDLFVKRIAAVAGETIPASENGAAAATVPPRALYVLGDNPSRSTDSRVWGFLPEEDLVGRPLLRIWPVSRIGPVH